MAYSFSQVRFINAHRFNVVFIVFVFIMCFCATDRNVQCTNDERLHRSLLKYNHKTQFIYKLLRTSIKSIRIFISVVNAFFLAIVVANTRDFMFVNVSLVSTATIENMPRPICKAFNLLPKTYTVFYTARLSIEFWQTMTNNIHVYIVNGWLARISENF